MLRWAHAMMRAVSRLAAVALVLVAALGCGGAGFDVRAVAKTCGLACAADELRYRLATSPRDRDLYVALAEIELERGRPGAALVALEAAEQLGRAFRGGLGSSDRTRLGRLLLARAEVRAARHSPDAEADLIRARRLGVTVPEALARTAALAAIAADLRHTDPVRRRRGRGRLTVTDPARAAALVGDGPLATLSLTAAWLDAARARRVLGEMLDAAVRTRGVAGLAAAPGAADRWLAARRWWAGEDGRPDVLTLERAEAAGAGPCWYARPRGACDVIAAAASVEPAGPPWEPTLVTVWERDGVQAAGLDQALAWMIVARRAVDRGQLASWERAVRDHVDVAGLAAEPRLPPWAAPAIARLAGRPPDEGGALALDAAALAAGPRRVVVAERDHGLTPIAALDGLASLDDAAWTDVAAALAAVTTDDRPPMASGPGSALTRSRVSRWGLALVEVAHAYGVDPALADRRAEDVLAVAIDLAAAAPPLARLFALLGDPARARALWQRAFDVSPEDGAVALGLALALAEAGDPAAGLVAMTRAAASWGDAGDAMLRGARGFAAAGHTVEALTLVRSAIELTAPGDEAPGAALAAALLDDLGRADNAAALRALAPVPGAWDGRDGRESVAAVTAAATRGSPTRRAALARLAHLASAADPSLARLAASALRAQLAPRRDPEVP